MSKGVELEFKLTGGKNLTRLRPGSRPFIAESLKYVTKEILKATAKGMTADGRALPAYSRGYLKSRQRQGLTSTPDMRRSGQLMRSMRGTVTNKMHGALRFGGAHIGADGERSQVKQRKKDGTVKTRNLTNQMLASILSFRQPGKRMPTRPLNFVPAGRFMDIGKKQADHILKLYNKYHERQLAGLPPALP